MHALKKLIYHPFLFAAYPVLALWATNFNQVEFNEVWRALLLSTAASVGLYLLLRLARLDAPRAGLLVAITALLFFSYGHVMFALARAQVNGSPILHPVLVTLCWPVGYIILVWLTLRILKDPRPITTFLNVVAVSLVIFAALQIAWMGLPALFRHEARLPDLSAAARPTAGSDPSAPLDSPAPLDRSAPLPDIYYIILDGYGRQDMLAEVMQFDNSAFIKELQARGFTIPSRSTSNYSNTTPSIASSLNLNYINDLANAVGPNTQDYRPLRQVIRESQIRAILKQRGYQIVTLETGFNLTEIHDSDHYLAIEGGPNYFESLLLTNSLALLWTNQPFAVRYQERIPGSFARLADLSGIPSPKFVFAHVMAAHPPFVFGPNGEVKSSASSVELDTSGKAVREAEIAGYRDQVTYINKLVLSTVDSILRHSSTPPVIILQGDHGSGIYMDWQSAENTCFAERKAIFDAYFFPGGKTEGLYDTITPVNSFRVVLNTYLGANLPLLEDRNYFSLWESPYKISDVTGVDGKCPFR